MKYFITLLLSFSALAESYEVSHKGHVYVYHDTPEALSLKSKRLSFEIPAKPCSKGLIEQVKKSFEESLKFSTASTQNVVRVKSSSSVNVPEGHKNGKYLIYFPDHFAKSYLVYKELCK